MMIFAVQGSRIPEGRKGNAAEVQGAEQGNKWEERERGRDGYTGKGEHTPQSRRMVLKNHH